MKRIIKRVLEVTGMIFMPTFFLLFLLLGIIQGVLWFSLSCLLLLVGIFVYTFESLRFEDNQKSQREIFND